MGGDPVPPEEIVGRVSYKLMYQPEDVGIVVFAEPRGERVPFPCVEYLLEQAEGPFTVSHDEDGDGCPGDDFENGNKFGSKGAWDGHLSSSVGRVPGPYPNPPCGPCSPYGVSVDKRPVRVYL